MIKENLPSSLTKSSEEPLTVTNFSPDVEQETINLNDDPVSSDQLQLMQLCHRWKKLNSFHY